MARRLPAGFREDPDSKELRCPHRELSTCPQCAAEHPERIVESYGVHYWMNVAERAEWDAFKAELAEELDQ